MAAGRSMGIHLEHPLARGQLPSDSLCHKPFIIIVTMIIIIINNNIIVGNNCNNLLKEPFTCAIFFFRKNDVCLLSGPRPGDSLQDVG